VETGNATEACRKAGYKEKNADVTAAQNLVKLRKYIDIKLQEKDSKRVASQDEVLEYLTRVLRGEEKEERYTFDGVVEMKARIVDRNDAAKQLAKIYGLSTKLEEKKVQLMEKELENKIKSDEKTQDILSQAKEQFESALEKFKNPQPNRTEEDIEDD
jgi:phage terminase small subunit